MKLFADENVARAIVMRLRDLGHDVILASEIRPGAPDADWLGRAEVEGRMILTSDKDFGELIFRDRLSSHGVILLRLEAMPLADRLPRLEQAWAAFEADAAGKFIVISPTKVRLRELGSELAP